MHHTEGFERFLRSHYSLSLSDVEISAHRGIWYVKGGCKGGTECKHAFRGELGPCDGHAKLCLSYAEFGVRDRSGRWVRPYRVWEEMSRATS